MLPSLIRRLKRRRSRGREINPEDIFLDSANLPGLNRDRFEGRMEKPVGERTFAVFRIVALLLVIFLGGKLWSLQIAQGSNFAAVSERNRLERTVIFADRGVIYDRNGLVLAQNQIKPDEADFAGRRYPNLEGLAAVVGYIKYPKKDANGVYYAEEYSGQAGVERSYDALLSGKNGSKLTETDALGDVTSESVIDSPVNGSDLTLSIDARLTEELFGAIKSVARDRGFTGGAGVIVDVETGEVLALTSYPEYNQNLVTDGSDSAAIGRLFSDKGNPFLDRAVAGLYTPGSIVKPLVALAALKEGTIDPATKILSTGKLVVPNPYDPSNPSVFRDWKAHGWVNMREALAVSSDVYFYEVGGGFGDQAGLGISRLDQYFKLFGLEEPTGIDLPGEGSGIIATPEWKAESFPDDPDWRLGNTYITSIGQYGTQVTPLEAVRWVAAIANGGKLLRPSVLLGGRPEGERALRQINLPEDELKVVREGMRLGVTTGVAQGLSNPNVAVAAKTGTAELGAKKEFVNSWVTGFFPYENPRYAFAVIMERGPVTNTVGGVSVFRQVLDWMAANTPEYLK